MTTLRMGTRGSALAMAQTELVAARLRGVLADDIEVVTIVSDGDRSAAPLQEIGGEGVFVTAIRQALIDGTIDVAVHSLKDLPTVQPEAVVLAAVPARDDARDVLVARDGLTLGELPVGSTVGTGSLRRASQLHALGLGLEVLPIRGNVDSRLAKVAAGEYDGVIVARAGVSRLGRDDAITEVIDPIQMLPAPGQGALAVEVSATRPDLATQIAVLLDDHATRSCVTAERALLRTLEAGCSAPVGALAEYISADEIAGEPAELWLRAVVATPDGARLARQSATGRPDDPAELGTRLAQELLADGADLLMAERAS